MSSNENSLKSLARRRAVSRLRNCAGLTLLEVVIALALFSVIAVGFTATYGRVNQRATQLRCSTIADAILRAKVAKLLTDPYTLFNTPVDCVVTSGELETFRDPNDPYDVGRDIGDPEGNNVILVSKSDAPDEAAISGTLYRNTRAFEAAAFTVIVDYRLNYTFRGKTYNNYASAIRARDL